MAAAKEPTTHLGAAIREARIRKGWVRQSELADRLAAMGYERSQDTVSNWERGERVPSNDEMFVLGVVLDNPDDLVEAWKRDGKERASVKMTVPHSREEVVSLLARCAAVTRRRSSICAPTAAVA